VNITIGDEKAWAQACSNPSTQLAALGLGLKQWTRQTRWIAKYKTHPRVIAWLESHPLPVGWQESREAYAWTEMPFPPGYFE
jgi:hypothetical protein